MNLGTLVGFLIAMSLFIGTAIFTLRDAMVLINFEAIAIVLGGTVSVALICFPIDRILALTKVFVKRMFGYNRYDYMEIVGEVVTIAKASQRGHRAVEAEAKNLKNLFLRDAVDLLFWAKTEIDTAELRDLLQTRAETHYKRYEREAKMFRVMAKFPTAFGLMGTVLGMVSLLQSLNGADSKNNIGPAMAVALIATLYGILTANFVLLPAAEHLEEQTEDDLLARCIVVEGVMLIHSQKSSKYIEEKLKGFLLPKERGQSGSGASSNGGGQRAA